MLDQLKIEQTRARMLEMCDSHGHLSALGRVRWWRRLPGSCGAKYSLMSPLSRTRYTHVPPPPRRASHNYYFVLRTEVLQPVMPAGDLPHLSRPAERKRGPQPRPLTFHPRCGGFFPQRTLRGSCFLLIIFPGSVQWGTSNKQRTLISKGHKHMEAL